MAQRGENGFWGRTLGALGLSRALTAAGSPLVEPRMTPGGPVRSGQSVTPTSGTPTRPDAIKVRRAEWQIKALLYSEAIPELAGAAALVRASLESVKWVVKGGNAATRARIQARVDEFDKARAMELVWVSGECYIAVPRDPQGSTPVEDVEAPFSLSVEEMQPSTDGHSPDRMRGPNDEWVDMVEEGTTRKIPFMRVWRRSKRNRWHAFSPVKAAMEVLDAMYLAQMVDTATQQSRLMYAGIVFWPTNADDVPIAPGEEPVPGSRQAMMSDFKAATQQVIDIHAKGQAATQPYVVMYDPGKGGEATKYQPEMFRIERQDLAEQRKIRTEVDMARLALSLELPIEAVTGMGSTNHWSAATIDQDKWKTWFAPLDKLVREQFIKQVVRQYGPEYTIEADATDLIGKPDESDIPVKLMQLEQVTPESGVDAIKNKDLNLLVAQKPPENGPRLNRAPGQPSDFGRGETDRGGGAYRDRP